MLLSLVLMKLLPKGLIVFHWVCFSKQEPFWSGTIQTWWMYLASICFLCAVQILHYLAGHVFSCPVVTVFSTLCLLKSPDSLPGGVLFRLLLHRLLRFHQNWTQLYLKISVFPAEISYTSLFNLCSMFLTQNMHWTVHSLQELVCTYSVGANGCGNCGVSWLVVFYIVFSVLFHQTYQSSKHFHFFLCNFQPLQCIFHCCAFCVWQRFGHSVNKWLRSLAIIAITILSTVSGLSVLALNLLVLRKLLSFGYFIDLHHTSLFLSSEWSLVSGLLRPP